LSQDLSISHDFLDQDSQVFHALAKRSSTRVSLIATHPTIYRAQCPLNQYGKFGITAEHKIRLCTQPNQPIGAPLITPKDVCLYDHFGLYYLL
jgi:hypothetical protein